MLSRREKRDGGQDVPRDRHRDFGGPGRIRAFLPGAYTMQLNRPDFAPACFFVSSFVEKCGQDGRCLILAIRDERKK
jgi:hypothetical protein